MKPSFILPVAALAGSALSAAVPQSQDLVPVLVPEFSDAAFTPADREDAYADAEDADKAYSAPGTYLDGEDAAYLASVDLDTEGAAAWASVHADLRAALIAHTDVTNFTAADADPYPVTLKWAGAHVENMNKNETAEREENRKLGRGIAALILYIFKPFFGGLATAQAKNGTQPTGGRPKIPDFHVGLDADGVCRYFQGAAWKAQELRRPMEQFSPEYVPWLVENKGPYIYVLDGLREIEWSFWTLGRALEYTSSFTEEEQFKIARCATLPISEPRHVHLFGFRSLLRLLEEKAPVSKYQTYANVRIVRVLENLDSSLESVRASVDRKLTSTAAKVYLIRSDYYDMYEQLDHTVWAFERNL
ncbi:hypothetical protein GCG54_00013821 [Colletotrichum gloeosporioides]|uniref:Uncharacterized protein n=1 Tax=Colletotrichum gloeosporioides TaxID=474922 RepID=A0A8H4CUV9_COLGL|nr:uncharacterized protein GCG54_00013821 [Colletotrichum gloeosporioides]KAF3810580.1 hypothetical protein GCG54_00013821 [Colletotrichum gloeosporioides]